MNSIRGRRLAGFTMVEMAMFLMIAAVLIGAGLKLLEQTEARNKQLLARARASAAKDALERFSSVNHRLPCPDLDGDGLEDECAANLVNAYGWLPVVTLGLSDEVSKKNIGLRPRYGVYRSQSADLAAPADQAGETAKSEYLIALRTAIVESSNKGRPYFSDTSGDCQSITVNLAAVILVPLTETDWVPSQGNGCFSINEATSGLSLTRSLAVASESS